MMSSTLSTRAAKGISNLPESISPVLSCSIPEVGRGDVNVSVEYEHHLMHILLETDKEVRLTTTTLSRDLTLEMTSLVRPYNYIPDC